MNGSFSDVLTGGGVTCMNRDRGSIRLSGVWFGSFFFIVQYFLFEGPQGRIIDGGAEPEIVVHCYGNK